MVNLIIIIFIYISFIHRSIVKPLKVLKGSVLLIFANIGSGKSCTLADIARRELKRIKKGKSPYKFIISNVHIKGVRYSSDLRGLLKKGMLQHCLILADEASVEWNNRAMNLNHLEREELKLIRHYHCSVVFLSQDFEDIDITIRRLYTEIYFLKSYGNWTIIKKVKKYLTIDPETKQFISGYEFILWIFGNRYLYKPTTYHLFDSYHQPDYIPVIDIENNRIDFKNGKYEDLETRLKLIQLRSASDMTLKEKLLCNRNIKKLLDSKLFRLKKGKLELVTEEELVEPVAKTIDDQSFNEMLDTLKKIKEIQ